MLKENDDHLAAVHPMAFLNGARAYHEAAKLLHDQGKGASDRDPLYMLYFHAVELALKAVLRSHGRPVSKGQAGHDIKTLYRKCLALGLEIAPADRLDFQNVVRLLASGNEDHAFRYFNLKSTAKPDMAWTREVVDKVMQAVSAQVDDHEPPGPAVKIDLIVGKPENRKAPRPLDMRGS